MADAVTSWAGAAASGIRSAFGAAKSAVWSSGEAADAEERARNGSTAVAVGVRSAMGTFKQVNKWGEPIYKYVSGGKLGWRQINEAGKGAIYKPTAWNGVFKGLGWASFAGAAGMDAYEIGKAAVEDYDNGTYDNTVVKSASVAGTWAGALSVSSLGASLFSVIPGVGTLIGGIGGGVLGAVYGAWGGEAAAKKFLPAADDERNK